MAKKIRIAACGVAQDYRTSLLPSVIGSLGYEIAWTRIRDADLVIFGPFFRPNRRLAWVPRPLRPAYLRLCEWFARPGRPLSLFQTGENLRHDQLPADFSLSFDLGVQDPGHLRLPYWMELVDWSHEGVTGNENPRFGQLLNLARLTRPLGHAFMGKPRRAAIFASHLREPRSTLLSAVQRHIPVHGFGPAFDAAVRHHSDSGFTKSEVLQGFAFNLCPENSMYPGYYTEKIPEAFMADSVPLAWTDSNVAVDFNPDALINLAPMMGDAYQALPDALSDSSLAHLAGEALLLSRPSIEPLVAFTREMLKTAMP